MKPEHERLNRYIDELQAGQHPGTGAPHSREEQELFEAAASWAAMRPGADEPDPTFVRDLRAQLGDMLANPPASGGEGRPHAPAPAPRPIGAPRDITTAAHTRIGGTGTAGGKRGWLPGRRQFITAMGTAAAGLVAGLGLDRLFGNEVQVYAEPAGQISPTQGKWFMVAQAADVKVGEGVPFTAGAVRGILLHRQDGFVALSGSCTHLGCQVSWLREKQVLACGCHGSSFDSSGKPLTGPAIYKEPIRGLHSFELKIENGVIHVLA